MRDDKDDNYAQALSLPAGLAARIGAPCPHACEVTMLKNLFRPKWRHADARVRLDALSRLHPLADAAIIRELALSDSDNNVRSTAIARLNDMALLKQLQQDSSTAIGNAARQRWIELLCDDSTTPRVTAEETIIGCEDQALLAAIIAHTKHPSLLQLAVAGLKDQRQLFEVAANATQRTVRLIACERLVDEDLLRELAKSLINKDKGAYQIVKQKLQTQRDTQQAEDERRGRVQQLLDDARALSRSEMQPQFEGKLRWLRQQQITLAQYLIASESEELETALAIADAKLAQFQQQQTQKIAAIERGDQLQSAQQALDEALKQRLETLVATNFADANLDDLQIELNSQREHWKALAVERAPHPLQQMNINRALDTFEDFINATRYLTEHRALLDDLQREIAEHTQFGALRDRIGALKQHRMQARWPDALPQPAVLDAIADAIANGEQRISALQADRASVKKQLLEQIEQCEQLLEQGDSASLGKLLNKVRQQLEKLSEQDSRPLEARLRTLQAKVDELHDWQHFATDPKREALCVEMEKLIKAKLPPPQKAQAIRELQDEWKSLGDSRNTQKLWQRFRKAADKAFAPCAEYFEQQKQLRQHNENQRIHIIEQLQQFIDGSDWHNLNGNGVDWKTVERLQPLARREWSHYTPIDRANAKSLQDRFNRVMDSLHEKLTEERQKNASLREQLIAQAQQLLQQNDVTAAIEQSRQLQTQWQQIGATWYKQNQQLWKQFRAAIDALYERRNQENQVAIDERDNNVAKARAICERIHALADQSDDLLLRSREEFAREKQSFAELGALPKQEFRTIQRQFNDACDHFETRIDGIDERSEQQSLDDMKELIARCEASERKTQTQAEMWLQPTSVPDNWWNRILPRLNGAATGSADERRKALLLMCIQAEIAAELETPAENQALRMEFQMQRLAAGLGKKPQLDTSELASELQLQWWSTSSRDIRDYTDLRKRFEATLSALRASGRK